MLLILRTIGHDIWHTTNYVLALEWNKWRHWQWICHTKSECGINKCTTIHLAQFMDEIWKIKISIGDNEVEHRIDWASWTFIHCNIIKSKKANPRMRVMFIHNIVSSSPSYEYQAWNSKPVQKCLNYQRLTNLFSDQWLKMVSSKGIASIWKKTILHQII